MSRRRTRYTVTVEAPPGTERKVVLAYGPDDARNYFARKGFAVVSVLKGDYRKAQPRRSLVDARPIPSAIEDAARLLGLKHPVVVRVSNRSGGVHGVHNGVPTGGCVRVAGGRAYHADTATGWEHRIMVKGYLSAENMGRTLWHELAHALQFERDHLSKGLTPTEVLRSRHASYRDGTTYRNKPDEVEAREHESLNDDLPLAR